MRKRLGIQGLCVGFLLLLQGCASMRVAKVKTWEAEGNDSALKAALADDNDAVQEAAIAAWVHYGEYDTGRPSVLAALQSSSAPAKRSSRSSATAALATRAASSTPSSSRKRACRSRPG